MKNVIISFLLAIVLMDKPEGTQLQNFIAVFIVSLLLIIPANIYLDDFFTKRRIGKNREKKMHRSIVRLINEKN